MLRRAELTYPGHRDEQHRGTPVSTLLTDNLQERLNDLFADDVLVYSSNPAASGPDYAPD